MRQAFRITNGLVLFLASVLGALADSTWEFSVQVSAMVESSPARITLTWPQDTYALPNSYTIYRKAPTATAWGQGITLPGTATSYVDQNVTGGTAYEYQVVKSASLYTGYGYLTAGIEVPLVDQRGRVLLVVENTYAAQLAAELARLQNDLAGDGWTVKRIDVTRTDTAMSVKDRIRSEYAADPAGTKAVFLFGRVPVPYSGNITPDGHTPDHTGAWPADAFYGDMDGTWTDTSVNNAGATEARNRNVPGDGKFDQSTFPSAIELMVGRVDLANMPGRLTWNGPATFPSELELLRNYLNKDHRFRHKQLEAPRRGVVGDYFGYRDGEAFAASGWRNFAPFFGASAVTTLPNKGTWIPTLSTDAYLWAYACGAGSYTSMGGIGNANVYNDGLSTDIVRNDVKAVFTLLFGSWLGDWDSEDNLLRSILATPSYGLTAGWSGRPHWFLHGMALGEPIGQGARLTQNNGANGLYRNQVNNCASQIHIALMGDPTLRMHVVSPPTDVVTSPSGAGMTVSWGPSAEAVQGYHVYRSTNVSEPFARLTATPQSGTSFADPSAPTGARYMVRAVKLETSGSGSYYNASQGAFSETSTNGTSPDSGTTTTNSPVTSTNSTVSGATGGSTNANATVTTNAPASSATTLTLWVDDALPAGAVPGADFGDAWSWIAADPVPANGSAAHRSLVAPGLHQHFFMNAKDTLSVNAGDVLITRIYLDPANPPNEVMLQWYDGSWEHRAYWGANRIVYGADGTASRRYMGPLPTTGQWAWLQVPAAQVGLEGRTVSGMAFSLFDGRASWDASGKGTVNTSTDSVSTTNSTTNTAPVTATNLTSTTTNTSLVTNLNTVAWFTDALPAGAQGGGYGGDTWNWITANPAPVSGATAHQSAIASGLHQHWFDWAGQSMRVESGDVLYAWAYLDPANPPRQLMIHWNDGSWEHRAYWGADLISFGTPNTAGRRYLGPLPEVGRWVRLQVPASLVELEGSTVRGMGFSAYDGRVTWDETGRGTLVIGSGTNATPDTVSPTNTVNASNELIWVEDALPSGAKGAADGGDAWNWVANSPAPLSGTSSHQSTLANGLHQHYFAGATTGLSVTNGEVLFSWVYVDPANPPRQLMLQWNDGSWEHRAYWGANLISYGRDGTEGRRYMGALPPAGQWTKLQVPASQVGLEGRTINGMAFSQVDGRATWDAAGKSAALSTNTSLIDSNSPVVNTNTTVVDTNTTVVDTNTTVVDTNTTVVNTNATVVNTNTTVVTTNTPVANTNSPVTGTNTAGLDTNAPASSTNVVQQGTNPGVERINYTTLQLPEVGDNALQVLMPNLLELKLINTREAGASAVSAWDLVNSSGQFAAPAASEFVVTANGRPVSVTAVGFKRRPLYAPYEVYDLRIDSSLYLQLAEPISDNTAVEVKNPSLSLWPTNMLFKQTMDPLRFSPAIHVNQEGYMPGYSKRAMVGYYLGSLGEMNVPGSAGFKLVEASSENTVYQGTLVERPDQGYTYTPTPYQRVFEADFTAFNTPGEYRLVVPGLGASLAFMIDAGIAMNFTRAYALGLYHQRCGTELTFPNTRHTHGVCHAAPASVPLPAASFPFTWNTVASYARTLNQDNPPQIAPALTSADAQLFPLQRQGTIDAAGGHHDAGDYSKYTINSASLVHYLMFSADSLPGVAALDNLGIPESGDGISDVLQEAKWEADYLAKIQDTDGGFYFLVYPKDREYESGTPPENGDPQVVWPKTTSATAAAVAALAQCASSPAMRAAYPQAAALYLQKAQLGWQFLTAAVAKYGKTGGYQKITHYGDNYADQDELAWAAAEMFLATGDQTIHQQLRNWFDPANPATWRWGWWHMSESYGHAVRSYAFAARSGRLPASALDAGYLAKCEAEIIAAGDATLNWSRISAYGTSFPDATKRVRAAGWYFSTDQAFDIAVAQQISAKPAYVDAILANMNYEGGCNPVNVTYVTGLGWKRQRDIVSQWAATDKRTLPPSGIPIGNVQASFGYLWNYAGLLEGVSFPNGDATTAPYPYYDRWGDSWNVSAEFVVLNSARSLGTLAWLAAQTPLKGQSWKPGAASIAAPSGTVAVGKPLTFTLQAPGLDLASARIVWEARDQEPAFGASYTISPKNSGAQWVEAEAQWPDGRRVVAKASFDANSPSLVWLDDALPAGAVAGAAGGDSWSWVSSNPPPQSGTKAHRSANVAGAHQHYFDNATATMAVGTGEILFTWVYLDPASPPTEIMLQWNDGSWEHRAYWGANQLNYGQDGTASRRYVGPLPATGQWMRLEVPASQVGLENRTVKGMAFTLMNGGATFDAAGKFNPATSPTSDVVQPTISVKDGKPMLTWASEPGIGYSVLGGESLAVTNWVELARVTAVSTETSWVDTSATAAQRFYGVRRQ